jgi:ribosomal protein S18 acetylase RimI-like enzyme
MTIVLSEEPPHKNEYFSLFETTGWNQNYQASPEELETANRNSWLTISVFDDEKLVGFGRVVTDFTLHAMIFDLIVLPDYRGRGIGATVLQALVKKCREQGIRDIQLFCAKDQKGFYEKNGFEARPGDAPGMQLRKSKP